MTDPKTILIVEDDGIIAADIRRTVQKLGYSVPAIAGEGEQAIARVAELKPDLVLMDIMLDGGMDGIQAAEEIRSRFDVPVVYLTAFADQAMLERAKQTRPFGYVLKPFKEKELHSSIEMAFYQHAAERRLRESEERYRALVEHSPEPILVHAAEQQVIYANDACLRFFGAGAPEDILGKSIWGFLSPEYHAVVRERLQRSRDTGEPAPALEEKYIRLDGAEVVAEVSSVPITYEGKPATQVVMRDVTARVLAEQALRESELKFRSIVEQSLDGIVLSDENNIVLEWNPAQETITGISRQEALGRNAMEIMLSTMTEGHRSPEYIERMQKTMDGFSATHKAPWLGEVIEYIFQRPDGKVRTMQSQTFPIRLGERLILCAINRDVTENRRASEALEQANEQLKQKVNELEMRSEQDVLLNEMGELLQSCRNVDEAYAVVRQYIAPLFAGQAGALFSLNPERNLLEPLASWDNPGTDTEFPPTDCWGLRRMRPYMVAEQENQLVCRHVERHHAAVLPGEQLNPTLRYLCVPMTAQGETLGLLHLEVAAEQPLERWQHLAVTAADRIGLALANLRLRESLRAQATRDSLSGLFNRRYLEETIDLELQRSFHSGNPLALALLSIDHYGEVIDEYGYAMGDVLLREVGAFLQATLPSNVVAGRYGGEDYLLLFPRMKAEKAQEILTHIQQAAGDLRIQHRGQFLGQVNLSAGVAGYPAEGATSWDLIKVAREALNHARNGNGG